MEREDALQFSIFAKMTGFAYFFKSEMQPSARLVELIAANMAEAGVESSADALALSADALLGEDAVKLLNEPNAGGSSRVSEALSIEMLSRAFGFRLKQTETQIRYWPANGAITDFSVLVDGVTLGVSVTRAMCGPGRPSFGAEQAVSLLNKKLSGVLQSTANACGEWAKQVLHIFAQDRAAVAALEAAYGTLPETVRADTVVLVTLCDGGMDVLFGETASAPLPKAKKVLKGAKDEEHLRHLGESNPMKANVQRV